MKPNPYQVGICPDCGKIRYRSRKHAKAMARRLHPNAHLSPYKCGDYWHFGNLPKAVKAGTDRRSLRPPKPREQKRRRFRDEQRA